MEAMIDEPSALEEFDRRIAARRHSIEELVNAVRIETPPIDIDDEHEQALRLLLDLEVALDGMVIDLPWGEVTVRASLAGYLQTVRRTIREHAADVDFGRGRAERVSESRRLALERLSRPPAGGGAAPGDAGHTEGRRERGEL